MKRGELLALQWFAATHPGRVRTVNEDAHISFPLTEPALGRVFAVADGMGGHQAGHIASQTSLEVLDKALKRWNGALPGSPSMKAAADALVAAFLEANGRLLELADRHARQAGMGTTLTAVYVRGTSFAWAHVGDSRLYLILADGNLQQLTADDGLVAQLVRAGRLTEEQARSHPKRHVLTQALGLTSGPPVQTHWGELAERQGLLLCTDGLTNTVGEDEIAAWLRDHPHEADGLIALANERGSPDNVTAVVVWPPESDEQR